MADPPQRVPNEILSLICEELAGDIASLRSVCRASRTLLVIAQPLLFRRVDLSARPLRCVLSWCSTVPLHAHLAMRVRSLTLQLPGAAVLDTEEDVRKLVNALTVCRNLEDLAMLAEPGEERTSTAQDIWIPRDCGLKLTRFTNSYFEYNAEMEEFLASQREIQFLDFPAGFGRRKWSLETNWGATNELLVPKLVAISTTWATLPARNGLRRIQLTSDLVPLINQCHAPSLTTLNFITSEAFVMPPLEFLDLVARSVPSILHLAMVQTGAKHERKVQSFSPRFTISRFVRLETFTLFTRSVIFYRNISASGALSHPLLSGSEPPLVEDNLPRMTANTMSASATLLRVAIGVLLENGEDQTFIASRDTPGGPICSRTEEGMDFEPLSMFF